MPPKYILVAKQMWVANATLTTLQVLSVIVPMMMVTAALGTDSRTAFMHGNAVTIVWSLGLWCFYRVRTWSAQALVTTATSATLLLVTFAGQQSWPAGFIVAALFLPIIVSTLSFWKVIDEAGTEEGSGRRSLLIMMSLPWGVGVVLGGLGLLGYYTFRGARALVGRIR